MNHQEFNDFLREVLAEIRLTLSSKAEQYSAGGDRFHNFHRAATFDYKRPVESLRGMQTKHRVAIADFLDRENITDTPYDEWKEKIVDNINYYLLMLGMVKDEFDRESDIPDLTEDIFVEGCPNCNRGPNSPIKIQYKYDKPYCTDCGRRI